MYRFDTSHFGIFRWVLSHKCARTFFGSWPGLRPPNINRFADVRISYNDPHASFATTLSTVFPFISLPPPPRPIHRFATIPSLSPSALVPSFVLFTLSFFAAFFSCSRFDSVSIALEESVLVILCQAQGMSQLVLFALTEET